MSETTKELVVVITRGVDDERGSVAWSIANGGISSGLSVIVFLTSSAVELARKGVADRARPNPLDPTIKEMMDKVLNNDGRIFVCPPCAAVRGITESDLIDGAVISGSGEIHGPIKNGAATLCF